MGKSKNFLDLSSRNATAFENLCKVMRNSPIALIGAGVSAGAGYPTWPDLMDLFHNTILEFPTLAASPKYINQLKRVEDPLWRAEEYRRLIGKTGYESLIWNTFRPKNGAPSNLLQALIKLNFGHVLTTNYDTSLETAYQGAGSELTVINWSDRREVGTFLREVAGRGDKRYFVYLHGKYDAPDRIVLTERDYAERYVLADEASKKLFAVFMVRPVVFIGFSLSDPELMNLIRSIQGYTQSEVPLHFVILPLLEGQDEGAIAGLLNGKYGIDPIFYPVTEKHERLLDILQALSRCMQPDAAGTVKEVGKRSAQKTAEIDPDDPHKGRWGGRAERNGRVLSAKVAAAEDDPDWFEVKLTVAPATTRGKPLTGKVTFYLHPTFKPDTVTVAVQDGKAEYEVYCYGAFTVGVLADNGRTKLELDLSTLPEAPLRFRTQ
ncbi:MAG: SIR2 family protein [Pyrinomonadaceae bacterium]